MYTIITLLLLIAVAWWYVRRSKPLPESNTDTFGARGEFKMWRERHGNRELLVDRSNAIHADLLGAVADLLKSNTDSDFAMDDLYAGQWASGDLQVNSDGIIIGTGRVCKTTLITPANTYGKRFKGEFVFESSVSISTATLGHALNATIPLSAGFTYATQSFTQENFQNQDKIIIEWEIYWS